MFITTLSCAAKACFIKDIHDWYCVLKTCVRSNKSRSRLNGWGGTWTPTIGSGWLLNHFSSGLQTLETYPCSSRWPHTHGQTLDLLSTCFWRQREHRREKWGRNREGVVGEVMGVWTGYKHILHIWILNKTFNLIKRSQSWGWVVLIRFL